MNDKLIDRWALIARTVFAAEDAISEDWAPRLHAAKDLPKDERDRVADEYCRAIAIEILSHAEKEETA